MAEHHVKVLVAIPTLNEAAHVAAVVRHLLSDAPPDTTVVVVDGGSTDGTVERVVRLVVQYANVRFLHNSLRIQSAAVNLAVRRFSMGADVLVRCDAHASYPPGFLTRLLATLASTGADSVVVPLDSLGETPLQKAVAWVSNSPLGTGGSAHRAGKRSGFVDHGHHAAFRMETFRATGGYDETFTHNEDAEFDCRQRALGARVYLDAGVRVGYYPRASLYGLFRQYRAYGAGRSRTARRHPRSLRLRQLAVPLHFVACALALAGFPWLPGLLAWPAFYVAVLTAASLELAITHRAWCGLLAGPAAAVMHFGWAIGFLSGLVTHREPGWRRDGQPLAFAKTTGASS